MSPSRGWTPKQTDRQTWTYTPTCCNCQLAEGDKPHPANYWGCRHAREELQKRKAKRTPKTATEVFSSNFTPGVSFMAALRGNAEQQRPQANPAPMICPTVTKQQNVPAPALQKETESRCDCQHMLLTLGNPQPVLIGTI
ncbi:uncharacterized protein LOC117283140 [Cryptotermes secundus]|uniref:uncharacterized protein LOC117283140 n=1 Tax=Cryptotermes secundus TaxID=105785 RepID=UPI001454E1ED|nr:uncharacterized protein LOC117283140 [Cryptotermes secundus]